MKKFSLYKSILILLLFNFNFLAAGRQAQIQEIHKKISDDLLVIKKDFPKTQSTIYSLLDQLGKMYKLTKDITTRKNEYKKTLKEKNIEYETLITENFSLKKEVDKLKQNLTEKTIALSATAKKLEKKELALNLISKEKEKLTQSLNLTSTSEPISPL